MKALLPKKTGRGRRQNGIALATVLFVTVVLSLLAGGLLFSANLETIATANYRGSTDALYIADAGMQAAQNWFENSYTPSPVTGYTTTAVPVTYNNANVVLDGMNNSYNFPNATVATAFTSTFHNAPVDQVGRYSVKATLISAHQVETLNGKVGLERWEIRSRGEWTAGSSTSLSSTTLVGYIEQQITPETNYAMFSTAKACSSITLGGGAIIDSYNSNFGTYAATAKTTGGDIGSDGNITAKGSVTLDGNSYVPGGSGGSCTSAPIGGMSPAGNFKMTGSVYNLTQPPTYDTPPMPPAASWNPLLLPPNSGVPLASPLPPGNYGDVILVGAGANMTLQGGAPGTTNVYNFNSITSLASANIVINPPGSIICRIVGQGTSNVFNLAGGSIINAGGAPSSMLVEYAGTGNISLAGNSSANFVIYAPNGNVNLMGNDNFYGAIIGATVTETGSASVHFDGALKNYIVKLGQFQVVSWNRVVN